MKILGTMISIVVTVVLFAELSYAQPVTKPHTFVPGTPAKAEEVNENLDVLYNKVNQLDAQDVQQRVTGGCGDGSSIQRINADGTVECENSAEHAAIADYAANAGLLDGEPASEFAEAWHFHDAGDITAGSLHSSRFSAHSDLGAEGYLDNASGDLAQNNGVLQDNLNADQLDGNEAAAFALANHNHVPGDDGHTHSSLSAPDGSPANALTVDSSGDVAIGTSDASGHQLHVMADVSGKSAVRGVDYDSSPLPNVYYTVADGLLGVESPEGLPSTPGSVGVLGRKRASGAEGVAVYGWNSDDGLKNYAMYAVADGSPIGGSNYAMYAVADGSPSFGGVNYGIYAKAENGPTNWAGYFVGDVKIEGNLETTGDIVGGSVTSTITGDIYAVSGTNNTYGNEGHLGGTNFGVLATSALIGGRAVYARATNTGSGTSYGGYFESAGEAGRGVYGYASNEGEVQNYGGYFESASPSGTGIYAKGGYNGYAADLVGNVRISSVLSGETIIELGEGLDYAEGFDVSEHESVKPGSVLIIDPENPGKLTLSVRPYDTKVAGIVAGANGLGSGVRLGADRFDRDVALAGRVYCNVDATESAVGAGDLLTTSNMPGYAMKAIDYERAQGAILGKAMEKLEKGTTGRILVLVTLQ